MERKAGRVDDVAAGTMKQVSIDGFDVLLVRLDDGFRAFNAHCTHYGAPLAEGLLSDGRITCPWHHACFDARNGDLLEPPAFDALASYAVRIDGDEVVVDLPEDPPDRRPLPGPGVPSTPTDALIVIIGGGASGYMAAQTLRERGETRSITMITPERRFPYDRPNLSKDYLAGHAEPAWMPLRPEEFFEKNRIDVAQGARVRHLDAARRTLELDDERILRYDTAIIATGCVPRRLEVPGADLRNVLTLRSYDDADAIIGASGTGRRAVVVGGSFIAMEAAASLVARGVSVTVVAPDAIPFERTLGPGIGALLQRTHEANGVTFRLGATVARFEGGDSVETVVLDNGDRLSANLVVIGIGVTPATDFVEGVEKEKDGGIVVDEHLSAAKGLYVAGDVASFIDRRTGERLRIEHWRTALQLGRVAAFNIAGTPRRYESVPFFWTQQFDATVRYVGHVREWDEIVYRGDVGARRFLAYYVRGGRVRAAAAMGRDRDLILVAEAMRTRGLPTIDVLPL